MYAYAWIILDLFAVLMFLYYVNKCATRGFVQTAVGLIACLAAALLAGILSPIVARLLYHGVVRDALDLVLTRRLDEMLLDSAATSVQIPELLPKGLMGLVQQFGTSFVDTAFDGDTGALVGSFIDTALQNPLISIMGGVLFFIIFWIALFILRRFSRLFEGVYRIPLIGTVNTILGGVVGIVEAAIVLYLIGIVLQLIIVFSSGELPFLNAQIIESTYIFRIFCR